MTTLDAYQEAALRTARGADGNLPTREYLALGLCSESGEVAGLVKKFARHGKPFSADDVADELGDVLWYAATLATVCGLSLADVADRNIAKLRRRYRDGFKPAGGGADADRAAAAARASADHSADAGKMADHFAGADKMVQPADHAVESAEMTTPALSPVPVPLPVEAPVQTAWDAAVTAFPHAALFRDDATVTKLAAYVFAPGRHVDPVERELFRVTVDARSIGHATNLFWKALAMADSGRRYCHCGNPLGSPSPFCSPECEVF